MTVHAGVPEKWFCPSEASPYSACVVTVILLHMN